VHVVGVLGTAFTMERPFYRRRLSERFGLEVVVPDEPDRQLVHRVIFDELVHGVIKDGSRAAFARVAGRLVDAGAQAIILGCTEIGMLMREEDVPVPMLDTTVLHVEAAVDYAVG
ncbi:MAG: aspartate/glutamate racemase family protein, partial [Spirochaetota bacterium]